MRWSAVFVALLLPLAAFGQDQSPDWADRLAISGDVRLRYESIDEAGEAGRERGRFRARFGLAADLSPDIDVVIRLSTGGDNPISTNQSFDGGFSGKDIRLDQAYVSWKPNAHLNVLAGKVQNPLFRAGGTQLVWDGDLNPEGLALSYKNGALFANAGVFAVEERSSGSDSMLYAVQVGGKFELGERGTMTAGGGYFAYSSTAGNTPFYDGAAQGNSVDAGGNYLFEYKDTELFAQFDTAVGDLPMRAWAHWVRNSEVDEQDSAWAIGASVGSAKKKGTWQAGWSYQELEADAVIGTFSDSDFGGGGTDSSGHVLKGKYALADNVALGATFFLNEVDRFQGSEHDYDRIQLDVEFRFK